MVVAVPDIKSFKIGDDHDFIVMASKKIRLFNIQIGDGIYDKVQNKEVIECVWNSVKDCKTSNVHQ